MVNKMTLHSLVYSFKDMDEFQLCITNNHGILLHYGTAKEFLKKRNKRFSECKNKKVCDFYIGKTVTKDRKYMVNITFEDNNY